MNFLFLLNELFFKQDFYTSYSTIFFCPTTIFLPGSWYKKKFVGPVLSRLTGCVICVCVPACLPADVRFSRTCKNIIRSTPITTTAVQHQQILPSYLAYYRNVCSPKIRTTTKATTVLQKIKYEFSDFT